MKKVMKERVMSTLILVNFSGRVDLKEYFSI